MSDLLTRLLAAGTPPELVGEVARELAMAAARQEVAQEAIEARREAECGRTRRYRQRGGGQVSPKLRAEILERDGYACLDCGSDDRLEIDHIIPLAKGGDPLHPDNLQTLCRPCNARKRDRIRNSDNRGKLRTISDSEVVQSSPSPSLSPQTPQTHPHPCKKQPARKGTRLPADWMPEPLPEELRASVAGWSVKDRQNELQRFRDWAASATGKNAIKLDWQAAWRNWMRTAVDEGRYANGRPTRTHDPGGGPDLVQRILRRQAASA